MIELSEAVEVDSPTINFSGLEEKLSDRLEREWLPEHYLNSCLRMEDENGIVRSCIGGKILDLYGARWSVSNSTLGNFRIYPSNDKRWETEPMNGRVITMMTCPSNPLTETQWKELVQTNNGKGRDAAIELLRSWGL